MASVQASGQSRGPARGRRSAWRSVQERWSAPSFAALTGLPLLLVAIMVVGLLLRAWPILQSTSPWALLSGRAWHPQQGLFGFYPFIAGTIWVTGLAMLIAVPPSLLTAVYLSEYARPRTRALMKPLLDLLAGIPSVVYGVWGVVVIVPWVQGRLAPALSRRLGDIPFFAANNPTGFSVIAGSIVLAVMVVPVIVAVTYEVLTAVPAGLREAALALGSTHWQAVKHVVLRKATAGVVAGIVLGFSRAFGETMAVLMVVGNVVRAPSSIFDPAYPLTALIANNYGEMMSIPLYDAALMAAALVLLLVILVFNVASALILRGVVRRAAL